MTEAELQQKLFNNLSRYFYVESEVWSVCHTRRIDLAMFHKSDIAHGYPVGIEIKTFSKKTGGDVGRWLLQAQRYSQLDFRNYGKMLILVAPQISGYVFEEGELTDAGHHENGRPTPHHNASTFIGQFNVGELQSYGGVDQDALFGGKPKIYRMVYKGSLIWDQRYDEFRVNNYDRLCR